MRDTVSCGSRVDEKASQASLRAADVKTSLTGHEVVSLVADSQNPQIIIFVIEIPFFPLALNQANFTASCKKNQSVTT